MYGGCALQIPCVYDHNIHVVSRSLLRNVWGLRAHTRCSTAVVCATWDDATRTYSVELEDIVSLERRIIVTRVIIDATGSLQAPRVPNDLRSTMECLRARVGTRRIGGCAIARKRVGVVGMFCIRLFFCLGGKECLMIGSFKKAQFVPQIAKDPLFLNVEKRIC